jgi:hypothetical protein
VRNPTDSTHLRGGWPAVLALVLLVVGVVACCVGGLTTWNWLYATFIRPFLDQGL